MDSKKVIDVVCGVIVKENQILICRRKSGSLLEGFWEFPGGKMEIGESPIESLSREIKEELELNIKVEGFFMENIHEYENIVVVLKSFMCSIVSGEIKMNEHDKVKWVRREHLLDFKFSPADIPFIKRLLK